MRRVIYYLLFFISTSSIGQVTKGNWLLGGNLSFSHSTSKVDNIGDSNSVLYIDVSPNVGYFLIDRLSVGSSASYFFTKAKSRDGAESKSKAFTIGPFIRYYILKPENDINVFAELAYRVNLDSNNSTKSFSPKVGTAIFLTDNVALEASVSYIMSKFKYDLPNVSDRSAKEILFGIGFQIHLEKQ